MRWELLEREPRARFLRRKRNMIQVALNQCDSQDERERYTLEIELINMRLQDMGELVYTTRRKASF